MNPKDSSWAQFENSDLSLSKQQMLQAINASDQRSQTWSTWASLRDRQPTGAFQVEVEQMQL
jgi:hypothetical protein